MKKIKTWFIAKFYKIGYNYAYTEMREFMKEIYQSPSWENDVWKFVNKKLTCKK